jgi:hypothetical protein
MGLLDRLLGRRSRRDDLPRGITIDDALAAYVIREHKAGRPIDDIVEDPYLKNRLTDEGRLRLLERADVIEAVRAHTAEMHDQP